MDLTFFHVAVNNSSKTASSLSDIRRIIDIKSTSNTVWRSDLFSSSVLKFQNAFRTFKQGLICRWISKCSLHQRVCLLKASHAALLEQERYPSCWLHQRSSADLMNLLHRYHWIAEGPSPFCQAKTVANQFSWLDLTGDWTFQQIVNSKMTNTTQHCSGKILWVAVWQILKHVHWR